MGYSLPADVMLRFPRWAIQQDAQRLRNLPVKAAIGHVYMLLLRDLRQRVDSKPDFFVRWVSAKIRALPPADATT